LALAYDIVAIMPCRKYLPQKGRSDQQMIESINGGKKGNTITITRTMMILLLRLRQIFRGGTDDAYMSHTRKRIVDTTPNIHIHYTILLYSKKMTDGMGWMIKKEKKRKQIQQWKSRRRRTNSNRNNKMWLI